MPEKINEQTLFSLYKDTNNTGLSAYHLLLETTLPHGLYFLLCIHSIPAHWSSYPLEIFFFLHQCSSTLYAHCHLIHSLFLLSMLHWIISNAQKMYTSLNLLCNYLSSWSECMGKSGWALLYCTIFLTAWLRRAKREERALIRVKSMMCSRLVVAYSRHFTTKPSGVRCGPRMAATSLCT